MKAVAQALKSAGKYVLSDHAKERIRQRTGIIAEDAAIEWVKAQVTTATSTKQDGHKTHYLTDAFEIVCDGVKVITVKPADSSNSYLSKFNDLLTKEISKLITQHTRILRKAEIAVAEAQLNFLRAKNPKTKEIIGKKLTEAIDWKCAIEDEIKAVEKAAKQYGVGI